MVVRAIHGIDDEAEARRLRAESVHLGTFLRQHDAAWAERFELSMDQFVGDHVEGLANVSFGVELARGVLNRTAHIRNAVRYRFPHPSIQTQEPPGHVRRGISARPMPG